MVSFTLYQTAQRLYIVRHSRDGPEEHWRVLRVDRTSAELAATEDPTCYTKPQLQRVLAALNAGVLPRGADAQDKWWRRCRSVSCCCCTWARLRTARYTPSGQPLIPQPAAGNQRHGGLQLVCEAHAIIGCVQFLEVGAAWGCGCWWLACADWSMTSAAALDCSPCLPAQGHF